VAVPGEEFTIARLRSGDTVTGELDIATVPLLSEQFEREKQEDLDAGLVVDLWKRVHRQQRPHVLQWAYSEHGEWLRIVLGAAATRLVDVTGLRDGLAIIEG
jgi:hypothetical protein